MRSLQEPGYKKLLDIEKIQESKHARYLRRLKENPERYAEFRKRENERRRKNRKRHNGQMTNNFVAKRTRLTSLESRIDRLQSQVESICNELGIQDVEPHE